MCQNQARTQEASGEGGGGAHAPGIVSEFLVALYMLRDFVNIVRTIA